MLQDTYSSGGTKGDAGRKKSEHCKAIDGSRGCWDGYDKVLRLVLGCGNQYSLNVLG